MRKARKHELLVMQHPNPIQHQAVLVSPGFGNGTKHQPTNVNTTANKKKRQDKTSKKPGPPSQKASATLHRPVGIKDRKMTAKSGCLATI